ncbi:MAG: CopD family protein [Methylobacteriaceae bacterium]|nr:CopD family protein [Methylobacteriaceae bacterium]
MELLTDLFGYLSVVVDGLVTVAQAIAVGGTLFLVLLARPLAGEIGVDGPRLAASVGRVAAWGALALVGAEASHVGLKAAAVVATLSVPVASLLDAQFVLAGLVKAGAALLLAGLLVRRGRETAASALVVLSVTILAAATLTTHAAARMDGRPLLLGAGFAHQLGAALWIGGIPVFVLALARLSDGPAWRRVGARFSRMSMVGVAALLASGTVMSLRYIGDWGGVYGTAYGVMVGAKVAMFGLLLLLGLGNLLLVERLRTAPATPIGRMRRFAEAEIGIGFTIFFAAASLTSVPPAIDLREDRVSWAEIVARNTPQMPRLVSPGHDELAKTRLQAQLDAEAARERDKPSRAFIPGSGEAPPRNAADIAWSEYNHHWAGLFVLLIGILAILDQAGWRPARHWPLIFLGLGAFLAVRADPDAWPLGSQGLVESFRDVETVQHRFFVLLIVGFALFEWRVRRERLRSGWSPLVFPVMCAVGGAFLLTHQHTISNVKDQLLIELTHTPIALLAVLAGWSRWLELRLDPGTDARLQRAMSWIWPFCLALIGAILILYREI